MSVFSERVKKLRKAKKQSQNEVGKALGKSRESISKYELGEREPDPNVIALLSRHFNVSSDYMLGITDDSENEAVDNSKSFSRKLYAFESYLKNEKFIPYLRLAVIMKDSNIETDKFKALICKYIEQVKQQKHP
jgi:transcriptional regulator with XRE-family HTH domain